MTPKETRVTLALISGFLLLAGLLLFFVPAENIWPYVLLFWSVGLGLGIGAAVSNAREINEEIAREKTQAPR